MHRRWDGLTWTVHTGRPPPPVPDHPTRHVMTTVGPVELSGWWRRFGGYVLDVVMIDDAIYVVTRLIRNADVALRAPLAPGVYPMTPRAQAAVVASALLIGLGYPLVLLRLRGQTVGMMAASVRAVDLVSGAALTSPQAWRRVLAYFLLVTLWVQIGDVVGFNHVIGPTPVADTLFRLVGGLGLLLTALWPLHDSRSQTLQDKAAGTIVIRTTQ
jgi:uncharacterized RDD family membrane protein YckC